MTKVIQVRTVCYGRHDAMIAEVSSFDFRSAGMKAPKYAVMPVGNANFDTEGYSTKAEAREAAKYLADVYGSTFQFIA